MSSYALSAIQMMTPSTFRRRNVTQSSSRPVSNLKSRNERRTSSQLHHRTPSRTKIKNDVTPVTAVTRCPAPPAPLSTLTFYDNGHHQNHPQSLTTTNNQHNFALSQLTMSQLSDSVSLSQKSLSTHSRMKGSSFHSVDLRRDQRIQSNIVNSMSRPSKVARTTYQSRPTRSSTSMNQTVMDADSKLSSSGARSRSYQLNHRRSTRTSNQVLPSSSKRMKMKNIPHDSRKEQELIKEEVRQQQNQEQDQQRKEVGLRRKNEECYFNTQDFSSSQSQLKSRILVLSPCKPTSSAAQRRTNSSKGSYHKSVLDSKKKHNNSNPQASTLHASPLPSTSRKRSWMEACIDVMKTPYRTGKTIFAQRMKVKQEDVQHQGLKREEVVDSMKMQKNNETMDIVHENVVRVDRTSCTTTSVTVASGKACSPDGSTVKLKQRKQPPSAFETPSRCTDNNGTLTQKNSNIKNAPQEDTQTIENNENGSCSNSIQVSKKRNDQSSSPSSSFSNTITQDTKELLQQMTELKKEIQAECLKYESSKAQTMERINEETNRIKREKEEALSEIKNEYKRIREYIEKFQHHLSVEIWPTQEKVNSEILSGFEEKKNYALDGINEYAQNVLRQLDEKEKEIKLGLEEKEKEFKLFDFFDLEARVASLQEVCHVGSSAIGTKEKKINESTLKVMESTSSIGSSNSRNEHKSRALDTSISKNQMVALRSIKNREKGDHYYTIDTRTHADPVNSFIKSPATIKNSEFSDVTSQMSDSYKDIKTAIMVSNGHNTTKRVSPIQSEDSSSMNKDNSTSSISSKSDYMITKKRDTSSTKNGLNFSSPIMKKRTLASSTSSIVNSSDEKPTIRYNLRSKKNASGGDALRGNNVMIKQISKEHAKVASKSESTTEGRKPTFSLASKNHKSIKTASSKDMGKETTMKQTNVSSQSKVHYGASKKQRTSRRRRRINGKVKQTLTQKVTTTTQGEISDHLLNVNEPTQAGTTPKNQIIPSPIDLELRRMTRTGHFNRVPQSPVGVDSNIDLPMIPSLDNFMPQARRSRAMIKPRFSFRSIHDTDSLSFS